MVAHRRTNGCTSTAGTTTATASADAGYLPAWQALSPTTRIGRVEEELDTIRSQITALYSRTSTRPPTLDVPAPPVATEVGSYRIVDDPFGQHPTSAAPAPAIEIGTYRLTKHGILIFVDGRADVYLAPHELVAWVTAGNHELRPFPQSYLLRFAGTIWTHPTS